MSQLPRSAFVVALISLGLALGGCSKANKDAGTNAPEEKQNDKPPAPSAKQTDQERIQGAWKIESIVFDGKKESDTDKITIIFNGNKMSIRVTPEHRDVSPFKLDETKSPKSLDIGDPAKKGDLLPGIYELNGDELKICFAKGSETRPTAFESKPGSRITFLTLRRGKDVPLEPEEKEPNFAEFPTAILGKWHFTQGETSFGFLAGDTEFTKDGRV